jgi:phage protein D
MALENYKLLSPWVSFEIMGGPAGVTGSDLRDALVSFKFKDVPGKVAKIEMQFDNSEGRFLNFAVLLIGLKLKLRFGYANLLSRPYLVPIKRIKAGSMGGGGKGVQSSQPDVYGIVSMEAPASVFGSKFRPEDDVWAPTSPMPLSRAIKQIARKYGFRETKIFVQEGLGIDTGKESLFDSAQIQENETVLAFLNRKADERGAVFYLRGNEFHWHRRDWKLRPHDEITYFQGPDLLNFALEGDYNLNLTRVKSKGLNPKTGALFSTIYDSQGQSIGLGTTPLRRGALPKSVQPTDIVTTISKKSAEAGIRRMLKHVLNRWKAKLTLVGNPTIFVGSALNLVNFGPVVDGTWYVREVEHKIDGRGFTTVVQVRGKKSSSSRGFTPFKQIFNSNGEAIGLGAAQAGLPVHNRSKRRKPRQKYD